MQWLKDKFLARQANNAAGFYWTMGVDIVGEVEHQGETFRVGAMGGQASLLAKNRPGAPIFLDPMQRSAILGSTLEDLVHATNPARAWQAGHYGMAAWTAFSQVMGPASSLAYVLQGFTQGPTAAAQSFIWDVSVSSAAVKHGYKSLGSGAVKTLVPKGRFGAAGIAGRTFFGMMASSVVGGAVSNTFGGPIGTVLGTLAGSAAGRLGFRAAPIATVGAAAVGVAALAGYGAYSVLRAGRQHAQRQRGIGTSGDTSAFFTQGAYTMRARAVQAIQKSHLNARSALGQEASFMHMPAKNYHSAYRF